MAKAGQWFVAGMSLALVGCVAGCGSSSSAPPPKPDTTSGVANAVSHSVQTSWGRFTLAPAIEAKVKAHKPINYVFSYAGAGIPLFSAQYNQGYSQGLRAGNAEYPLHGAKLTPVQPDVHAQLSQIEANLAAKQIDCLSVGPADATAFAPVINRMLDEGIPVFTVGVPTESHELTNFTQIPEKEGKQTAQAVIAWLKRTGTTAKVFAVSTGAPTQPYSIGRIDGFVKAIKAAIPGATFATSQKNPLNMTYDPSAAYTKVKAFLTAHADVDVLENVDIGAEIADKAIASLKGKTKTIGWNLTKAQLDYISSGTQIATMDQKWVDQAAFGAKACAHFMATGKVLPNTQTLKPYAKAQVAEARSELAKVAG